MSFEVTVVNACLRDGRGGSPTAIVDEVTLSDDERRRVPGAVGASHAVFVAQDGPSVSLRFFTANRELPACGHGTVAALAALAERAGGEVYDATLSAGGRTFAGRAVRNAGEVAATFDPGPVALREPTANELSLVLPALGVDGPAARVASVGRWRMLVPVASRAALDALSPDLDRLRDACDRLDLLGCYVYSAPRAEGPATSGRLAARMFAPAIGVPEDIANANSTACLVAHLAHRGITDITVDMGDSLGDPATIVATAGAGENGHGVRVGGAATVARRLHLS